MEFHFVLTENENLSQNPTTANIVEQNPHIKSKHTLLINALRLPYSVDKVL